MITGIRDIFSLSLIGLIVISIFVYLLRSLSLSRIQSHIDEEIEYYKE